MIMTLEQIRNRQVSINARLRELFEMNQVVVGYVTGTQCEIGSKRTDGGIESPGLLQDVGRQQNETNEFIDLLWDTYKRFADGVYTPAVGINAEPVNGAPEVREIIEHANRTVDIVNGPLAGCTVFEHVDFGESNVNDAPKSSEDLNRKPQ